MPPVQLPPDLLALMDKGVSVIVGSRDILTVAPLATILATIAGTALGLLIALERAFLLRVLEALSATGLRSVRYWKEVEGLDSVVANDVLPSAVAAIAPRQRRSEDAAMIRAIVAEVRPSVRGALGWLLHRSNKVAAIGLAATGAGSR